MATEGTRRQSGGKLSAGFPGLAGYLKAVWLEMLAGFPGLAGYLKAVWLDFSAAFPGLAGYLKAVWLEFFGRFPWFSWVPEGSLGGNCRPVFLV